MHAAFFLITKTTKVLGASIGFYLTNITNITTHNGIKKYSCTFWIFNF